MAVSLALAKERDPALPKIRLQSLIYPDLQAFDFYLPAYITHADGPGVLRKHDMVNYWLYYAFGNISFHNEFATNNHILDELIHSKYASYVDINMLPKGIKESVNGRQTHAKGNKSLSDAIQNVILDSRYAPLMASDEELALLPTTYLLIMEFDVLRDDGFLAVERLQKVGVPVEHIYLTGEEHGLLLLIAADDNAKAEIKRFATFFNKTMS